MFFLSLRDVANSLRKAPLPEDFYEVYPEYYGMMEKKSTLMCQRISMGEHNDEGHRPAGCRHSPASLAEELEALLTRSRSRLVGAERTECKSRGDEDGDSRF